MDGPAVHGGGVGVPARGLGEDVGRASLHADRELEGDDHGALAGRQLNHRHATGHAGHARRWLRAPGDLDADAGRARPQRDAHREREAARGGHGDAEVCAERVAGRDGERDDVAVVQAQRAGVRLEEVYERQACGSASCFRPS